MIVDLFAGPGGWSEGLRMLSPELHALEAGIEWDDAACATRAAAGHRTIRADIAAYPVEPFVGKVTGLIASPPCQDFSVAGKRAGIDGDRGQLVAEVVRWADALRPEWIACEQVPPVLPIWQDYAAALRAHGYSTWCGILNAADYGVPQTRRRAILIASRTRPALPPEPTHAKEPAPSLFGPELPPWVSMADALGWSGFTTDYVRGAGISERHGPRPGRRADEPAPTLTGAALGAGGGTKLVLRTGNNSMVTGRTGSRAGEGDVQPYDRPIDRPAPTVDTKAGSAWVFTQPATTVAGDPRITARCHHDDGSQGSNAKSTEQVRAGDYAGTEPVKLTVAEALVLQSFPADYPVKGNKGKRFEQVGNAVPPLLAAHVLAAITGHVFTPAVEERAA